MNKNIFQKGEKSPMKPKLKIPGSKNDRELEFTRLNC